MTGDEVIVNALRIRAATVSEGAHAEQPRVVESELLEGAAEAVSVEYDDERRAIEKLSVVDAALRTLRLAALPAHGAKRQSKASGGSSHALVTEARKTAPKAPRAVAMERAGPADTYERKLTIACTDFKGPDGRQHFKERLARNLERLGVKVSEPRLVQGWLCRLLASDHLDCQAPSTFMDMKLDLHKLFMQVAVAGGAEAVSKEGTWSGVLSAVFAITDVAPGAAAQLRLLYEEVLHAFERRCVKKVDGSAPAKYGSQRTPRFRTQGNADAAMPQACRREGVK